jgi:hypothetical protein
MFYAQDLHKTALTAKITGKTLREPKFLNGPENSAKPFRLHGKFQFYLAFTFLFKINNME